MSRPGRPIIPDRTIPAQPGHLALTGSRPGTGRSARVEDQPTTITIFRLRRRLPRQPTGWHTERRLLEPDSHSAAFRLLRDARAAAGGDTEDMSRERAEAYLRGLAEAELRRAASQPGDSAPRAGSTARVKR